jgi:tetratricopeptide (TPR) repeat protein
MGGARAANLETIAFLVLAAMAFLLPVFFLPSLSVPFQFTKTLIIFIGTLLSLAVLIVARLREGVIALPISLVVLGGWLVALAYVLSGLFASENLLSSFIGQRFDVDTVSFMVVMALLLTMTPLIVRTKQRAVQLILSVLVASALLAIYQIARFVGGVESLSFDVFTTSTANLFGKWNDLGIFFGLVVILSLLSIEIVPFGKWIKLAIGMLVALSLLVLAVVNFEPVWIALGLFSLGLFIKGFIKGKASVAPVAVSFPHEMDETVAPPKSERRVSIGALVILTISLVFVWQGSVIGNYFADVFGVSQVEARPSWTTTISIAGEAYKNNPLFGSSPNSFIEQWARYKPTEVNETAFWNIDFTAGIGTIPTALITTGIVGALAWFGFLLSILFVGLRGLVLRPPEDQLAYQLAATAFVAVVYLFALSIVYVTSASLVAFAFLFTGVFLAMLRFSADGPKEKRLDFTDNPRLGFVAVLVLTVMLIGTIIGLYSVGQQYVAAYHFQKSVVNLNIEGDVPTARANLDRAVALSPLDTYYRFASQIGLVELNQIVVETEGSIEERRARFEQTLGVTVRNALRATEVGPTNYQNWLTLGSVYQAVLPLGIEGAYTSALNAYIRSRELAPNNPAIELALAQLEVLNGDNVEGRVHIDRALGLKSNYTAAIFLLAQLQVQAGEVVDAVRSVEATTILVPDNPVLFFQLGILRFNVGDFAGAAAALERAVALNDTYANARYFLGLTYEGLGRTAEAIVQFEEVQKFNPDNEEVKIILANLQAGNPPFAGLETSGDITDREELPIEGE